jgi:lipopolysaccharide biosynthesis protein
VHTTNKTSVLILHLYYQDLWEEFAKKIDSVYYDCDLYVTTCVDHEDMSEVIHKRYPDAKVVRVQNKGLDIGPFLLAMDDILKSNKEYQRIIKLHTKKSLNHKMHENYGNHWRTSLVNSLIGNVETYERNKELMFSNQMIGSSEHTQITGGHRIFIEWLREAADLFQIELKKKEYHYVGGTMFMADFQMIKKYFQRTSLLSVYKNLKEGYEKDFLLEHKIERIFGVMVEYDGSTIAKTHQI